MRIKGLLEMMFEVLSEWIETFIHDMEGLEAAEGVATPQQTASNGTTPPTSTNTSPRGSHHLHTASGMPMNGGFMLSSVAGGDVSYDCIIRMFLCQLGSKRFKPRRASFQCQCLGCLYGFRTSHGADCLNE